MGTAAALSLMNLYIRRFIRRPTFLDHQDLKLTSRRMPLPAMAESSTCGFYRCPHHVQLRFYPYCGDWFVVEDIIEI